MLFSPQGAPASVLLGGTVGALAVSPGWSPAQLVIHHTLPADREGFFAFKDFPFECKCSCGSSRQCGCLDGFNV